MIRHPLIQIFLLIVILLAETTFLKNISIFNARPSIYFVCFVFAAYAQPDIRGIVIGFVVGLAVDFVSAAPLGATSFSLSLLGFLLGNLRGKIFVDPIFIPMIMAIAASFIFTITNSFLFSIFNIESSVVLISSNLLVHFFMNALIAPICYGILRLSGIVPQYIREDNR